MHLYKIKLPIHRQLQAEQSVSDAEPGQYAYSLEEQTPLRELLQPTAESSRDFATAFRQSFIHCIQHHRYIVATLKKMERFYSPIWFVKIGEVTFLMCLVAFVSTPFDPRYYFSPERHFVARM